MATETTVSYQEQFDNAVAMAKLDLWVWVKDHIWIAIVFVLFVLLLKYVIVPALPDLCKKYVDSWENGKKQKDYAVQDGDRLISNLPAPSVDSRYAKNLLPREVDNLAKKIENTPDSRFRYCVVCPDKSLAKHYAVLFFERINQATTVDRIGWINYQRPRDKTLELCAKHCMIYDLNLKSEIDSVEKRFKAQCTCFKRADLHSMLIFWMQEDALDDDAELRQIAALEGLSVVLFAMSSVEGFENLVIQEKGGKSE